MIRVAGIAMGYLTDGRPNDELWMAAQMQDHFVPGTVAILSRHGGVVIGTLDTLVADGRDLRFTGSVQDYTDLVERLRQGSIPVSIETAWGGEPLPAGLSYRNDVDGGLVKPSFTGAIKLGANVVGLALTDRPGARGSVLWRVMDGAG